MFRLVFTGAGLLFFASGCANVHATIDREANGERRSLEAWSDRMYAFASCKDGGVGDRCGLIVEHTAKESFREKFRERVCAAQDADGCQKAFNRYVDAQLARRYFAADRDEVARTCDLGPPKCDDSIAFERLLLASHNAAVRVKHVEAEEQIEAERARRHNARNEEVAAGLVAALAAGAAVTQLAAKCKSYADVFTGRTLTTCSQ